MKIGQYGCITIFKKGGLLNFYFKVKCLFVGFDDMQNRFVPEWVSSFAKHDKKWVKVQAGQHHTMLLDEAGMYAIEVVLHDQTESYPF